LARSAKRRLDIRNIQYEKFAAGLAQKMAGIKRAVAREEIRSAG